MKNLIFVCVQFTQIKNIPLHVPLSVAYPTIYFGCIENSMKRKCSIYSILIIFSISWLLPNHFHQMRVRACNVKCKIFNSIWTVIKVCQAWFQIYTMYYLLSAIWLHLFQLPRDLAGVRVRQQGRSFLQSPTSTGGTTCGQASGQLV